MMQRPRRALFLAAIASAVLIGGAPALGCPKPVAADYAGYWRYAGNTSFMGVFEPAKGNSGVEFRDGVAYSYTNGKKMESTGTYTMKDDQLVIPGYWAITYYFATCNRNELSASSFMSTDTYRRAKRP